MESMSAIWKKLSLIDFEGSKHSMKDEPIMEDYLLATKFYTRRVLSTEAIAKTFKLVWRTRKGFEVRDMGNHLVLFSFSDEPDVAKVMQGESWSFDKHLVAIQVMERHEDITSLDFDETSFWVQIHGLLVGSMSHKFALTVCLVMGKAVENVDGEGK